MENELEKDHMTDIPSWGPHGKALKAYWEGDEEAKIGIEMVGEGAVWMPVSIYFREGDEFPGVEEYALELCEGRVLDVGAGAGAHCLALQELGFEVVGLDIAPEAVEVMRLRGVEHAVAEDFQNFTSEMGFDTLLFLMNGIGVAGTLEGLRRFLSHARTLVGPGGQILMDSADLRETGMAKEEGGGYFGEISYRLIFKEMTGAEYNWLYVDAEKLEEVAEECGWYCQVVYVAGEGSYLARLIG